MGNTQDSTGSSEFFKADESKDSADVKERPSFLRSPLVMSPREEIEEEIRLFELPLQYLRETEALSRNIGDDLDCIRLSYPRDRAGGLGWLRPSDRSTLATSLREEMEKGFRPPEIRPWRPQRPTLVMRQREETEKKIRPAETRLWDPHETEAQRVFWKHKSDSSQAGVKAKKRHTSADSDDSSTSSVSVKSDQSKGHNIDFKESSSLRAASTSSSEEDEFSESIKSDRSKDSVDVKERRSSLKVPFKGKNRRSEVDVNEEKRHSSPDQKRPDSPGLSVPKRSRLSTHPLGLWDTKQWDKMRPSPTQMCTV